MQWTTTGTLAAPQQTESRVSTRSWKTCFRRTWQWQSASVDCSGFTVQWSRLGRIEGRSTIWRPGTTQRDCQKKRPSTASLWWSTLLLQWYSTSEQLPPVQWSPSIRRARSCAHRKKKKERARRPASAPQLGQRPFPAGISSRSMLRSPCQCSIWPLSMNDGMSKNARPLWQVGFTSRPVECPSCSPRRRSTRMWYLCAGRLLTLFPSSRWSATRKRLLHWKTCWRTGSSEMNWGWTMYWTLLPRYEILNLFHWKSFEILYIQVIYKKLC